MAARTEEEARNTYPWGTEAHEYRILATWARPEYVKVELIGSAKPGTKAGVVLASFNAG